MTVGQYLLLSFLFQRQALLLTHFLPIFSQIKNLEKGAKKNY